MYTTSTKSKVIQFWFRRQINEIRQMHRLKYGAIIDYNAIHSPFRKQSVSIIIHFRVFISAFTYVSPSGCGVSANRIRRWPGHQGYWRETGAQEPSVMRYGGALVIDTTTLADTGGEEKSIRQRQHLTLRHSRASRPRSTQRNHKNDIIIKFMEISNSHRVNGTGY